MKAARNSGGVTLVEVLAVIAVLVILVGLTVPELRIGRERARRAVCERQLASHLAVIAGYAADHSDAWPFAFEKDRCEPRALLDGSPLRPSATYEAGSALWQYPVLEAYGGRAFHESLICPSDWTTRRDIAGALGAVSGDEAAIRTPLSYLMSMAMLLSPDALDPEHPSTDPRFHVGQTFASVDFSSQKAALFELRPIHDSQFDIANGITLLGRSYLTVVAAADGSTRSRPSRTFVPGVVFNQGVQGLERESRAAGARLMYTPKGVRGRDW